MFRSRLDTDAIIAVVIPCYKVRDHILDLLSCIGPEVSSIFVIDDCCPQGTGALVELECSDERVRVVYHKANKGVGGAVMTGYIKAIDKGCQVIVKLDGDGQMDPNLIPIFVKPILEGAADYSKGNRFFSIEDVKSMPKIRVFGNAVLSFMAKFSTGYWNIFDPTNGYTAIHSSVASYLPMNKISHRYFFETDLLFRLNTLRAVVVDIPMKAKYGEEVSNLKIKNIMGEFVVKHLKNAFKRIFYNYYLRDMSAASIELPLGILFISFGLLYGVVHWVGGLSDNLVAPAGTVMLAALPVILGAQQLIGFINFDVFNVPTRPISSSLFSLTDSKIKFDK